MFWFLGSRSKSLDSFWPSLKALITTIRPYSLMKLCYQKRKKYQANQDHLGLLAPSSLWFVNFIERPNRCTISSVDQLKVVASDLYYVWRLYHHSRGIHFQPTSTCIKFKFNRRRKMLTENNVGV